jgi:hypothetical protein
MGDGHIVPRLQMRGDRRPGLRVVLVEELQGTIRERNPEPECGVGRILLDKADVDLRAAPFEQVAEIEPSRPRTQDRDMHGGSLRNFLNYRSR